EQTALYQRFYNWALTEGPSWMGWGVGDGGPNSVDASAVMTYVCPSDAIPDPPVGQLSLTDFPTSTGQPAYVGLASYHPSGGAAGFAPSPLDGVITIYADTYDQGCRIMDILDGTSETILFGEKFNGDPNFNAFSFLWSGFFNSTRAFSFPQWLNGS